MKKRLFAVLMMLVMLVMLIAAMVITAQAATVPENVEWIELGSKEDFLEWFGGTTTLSDSTVVCKNMTENYTAGMTRYYKLTADITIDVDSTVYCLAHSTAQVNTYFDLNGKTLTYSSPASAAKRFFNANNANTTHTFVNGNVVNNSTSNYSGSVFLMSAGNLVMEDVVITDNARNMTYTSHGKMIYSAAGGSVTLTNVDITVGLNRATDKGYGLAVHSVNGNLTMTGCNLVYAGTESVNRGGLIYKSAGITNITNCTFAGGYTRYGGNVFVQDGDCNFTGCTFTAGKCLTTSEGVNVRIANNSGKKNTAVFTNCTFNGSTATASLGGNVYSAYNTSTTYRNCTFIGGKAANGGSIYAMDAATTFEDCKISGGTATGEGGNVIAKNNTVYFVNTDVSGGTATTGGNISASNKAVIYVRGGTISGGKATNGGNISAYISGAITPGPTLYLESGTITGGVATTEGGNIYAAILDKNNKGQPNVRLSGATVTGGKATSGGNISVHGVKDVLAALIMTKGTVSDGEAKEGGNIYAVYATAAISGGEVSNGHATTIAGNIYPCTAATVTISGTAVVSGGKAETRGGNFYMSSTNTVLNIQGGTVKDGIAYHTGGNIDVNNGKLNVTGGVITGGYAERTGGNIYSALGYGDAAAACGYVSIKDDGNAETPVPQITNGVALQYGGNIYSACNGNAKATGANKLILGNAIISGGDARENLGDDLFIAGVTILEILPEFAQDLSCYISQQETGLLPEILPGSAFANNRGISTGEFTGKLSVENYDNIEIYAKDGTLYFTGAALVTDGAKVWYKTNADAVAAYAGASYLQAAPGELVLPEGAYVVDLAGQTVAITGAGSVTLFDSANDDFATFGTATIEGVQLLNTALTRVLNKDYYTMEAEGAYSFHRVEARLTSVALRPYMGGIYYTAKWSCDDTVKPLIEGFGIAVSMKNFTGSDFANDETALYTVFAADAFESGVTKTGAMIAGILKDTTPERIAMNSIYAQMDVFAEAYITIDGVTYTGIGANYSMYDVMKAVADKLNDYSTQAATMQDFMTQWSAKGLVGEPWDSLDFNVSEDVMTLNTLYAGLQPYYGELHDHAKTGGTSDGLQTLELWKSELERLNMDFATIVDHRQSLHMYLEDWDNAIFIGGSEAACTITDRTGVKLHYNMIFSDPEGLEAVVTAFTEFNARIWTESDKAGTAGQWHFDYPNFTAARFAELCEAVRANGGFMALVHPKSVGYISSENPADAYFVDGVGMEVFYTYRANRDGWQTKANHKLWTDMMKAGYKVYATAGNDEHDMPSDKATSVIYAAERGADAWVEQLRKGQFVAGGVGVRSAMGDTMMGGTTSFEGKRFTFSVGDFHESLYDPTHTYRADVYDQNGVVFSQEVSTTETTYMAFDADNASNYYYIEIYDVTADSMIAIGNPIWNEK